MKKTILLLSAIIFLAFMSCVKYQEPQKSEKPKEKLSPPLKDAIFLLSSKEGWNDGSTSAYRGHIMVLRQDGTFLQDMFAKANPDTKMKSLGFNSNSMTVLENKLYVLSTQGHNDNAPQIHIMDNKTLKLEKEINISPFIVEGIPLIVQRLYVLSNKKGYIFFNGSINSIDFQTGKLGESLSGLDASYEITHPFYEFNGKLYSMCYDYVNRAIMVIDPKTDNISYVDLDGGDEQPIYVMNDGLGNLISLNSSYGNWSMTKVSLSSMKSENAINIPTKVGRTAALLAEKSIVFFNGAYDETNKTNEEKTIFRFNYQTKKLDKFAELKTDKPKSTIYNMRLFVNPINKRLIASVLDDVTLKFIRIFDYNTSELPSKYEKEYIYDPKCSGVTEIVINPIIDIQD